MDFGPTLPASHPPQRYQLWSYDVNAADVFYDQPTRGRRRRRALRCPRRHKSKSSSIVHVASPPPSAALIISPEPATVPRHVHAGKPGCFLVSARQTSGVFGCLRRQRARRLQRSLGLLRARVTLHPPVACGLTSYRPGRRRARYRRLSNDGCTCNVHTARNVIFTRPGI